MCLNFSNKPWAYTLYNVHYSLFIKLLVLVHTPLTQDQDRLLHLKLEIYATYLSRNY